MKLQKSTKESLANSAPRGPQTIIQFYNSSVFDLYMIVKLLRIVKLNTIKLSPPSE